MASQETKTVTEAVKQPVKKKVVKDATKKKKPVRKPQKQSVAVSRSATKPPTGTCADWIKSAGIVDVGSANALIGGESGCEPGRLNPSSFACGIAQSLPCTKMYPHATNDWIRANAVWKNGKMYLPNPDPVHELKWMSTYIKGRYQTWARAYAFWLSQSPHWY